MSLIIWGTHKTKNINIMNSRKHQKAVLLEMAKSMILAILFLTILSNMPVQKPRFVINPTERCEVEPAEQSIGKIPAYYINGDKETRYNRMNENKYIYMIPSSEKVRIINIMDAA